MQPPHLPTPHRARALLAESIQRQIIPEYRHQYAFDGHRCDRIVDRVLSRITAHSPCSAERYQLLRHTPRSVR